MKSITHFVFGYGSLICPKSRAVTSPEQAHKIATPVMVQGVERVWSKRTNRGMTAMGVRFVKDASCVGVILPVTNGELAAFDKREMGYDRVPLQLEDVGGVPFLSEQHYEEDDHDVFLDAKKQNNTQAIQIWVYVQRVIQPPTADHPIVQTYVDTILRGCLSISKNSPPSSFPAPRAGIRRNFQTTKTASHRPRPQTILTMKASKEFG